ncbi:MAG: serine/threonine protein kinase [Lentisphaeria bacterium]|nr:serine/threonine protein kinase [Lentisphaeria bacterium]
MASAKLVFTEIQDLRGGGMARLTLALDSEGRQVVVRRLLASKLLKGRDRKGFVKGTRIREMLSPDPHIVNSFECGRRGVLPYEIIEFISGRDIKAMLHDDRAYVQANAYDICRQCAMALAYLHERGIMHLDVKPENFLVDESGTGLQVKVTDFDLSMKVTGAPRRVRNQGGTRAYLAPEVMRNGEVSQAADVFAYGVMAYLLTTGRMPFQDGKERKARWKQMSESYKVKPPREYVPDLMPKIEQVILRCLEKRPQHRYPNMILLCRDLGLR